MRSIFVMAGTVLSFLLMMTITPFPNLEFSCDHFPRVGVANAGAGQQLAQDDSNDSNANPDADQPSDTDNSNATGDNGENPDQSNVQQGDDNGDAPQASPQDSDNGTEPPDMSAAPQDNDSDNPQQNYQDPDQQQNQSPDD